MCCESRPWVEVTVRLHPAVALPPKGESLVPSGVPPNGQVGWPSEWPDAHSAGEEESCAALCASSPQHRASFPKATRRPLLHIRQSSRDPDGLRILSTRVSTWSLRFDEIFELLFYVDRRGIARPYIWFMCRLLWM
jgi:hypothetical protein